LVSEPVAASFYSQITPLHRINTRNGEIICLQKSGMQYLVLDLGGELLTSFKVSYHPCGNSKLIFVYDRRKGF